jgi:hypothetical protein
MADHGLFYEVLRDFNAGILTLIGGGLAYFAGHVQATATRQAAAAQVVAIRKQMDLADGDALAQIEALKRQIDQRNREIADLQKRTVRDTVAALGAESAHVHRCARDRLSIAEENFSETLDAPIPPDVAPYRIVLGDVFSKVSVADFLGTGIRPSADTLNARIRILASALESAGIANKLTGGALIGHLQNVISAAEVLRKHVEKWETDNLSQGHWTA